MDGEPRIEVICPYCGSNDVYFEGSGPSEDENPVEKSISAMNMFECGRCGRTFDVRGTYGTSVIISGFFNEDDLDDDWTTINAVPDYEYQTYKIISPEKCRSAEDLRRERERGYIYDDRETYDDIIFEDIVDNKTNDSGIVFKDAWSNAKKPKAAKKKKTVRKASSKACKPKTGTKIVNKKSKKPLKRTA